MKFDNYPGVYNGNMGEVTGTIAPEPIKVDFKERLLGFVESQEEKIGVSKAERGKLGKDVADLGGKMGKGWLKATDQFVTEMGISMDDRYPGYAYNMLEMVVKETKARLEKNGVKSEEAK